MNGNYFQLGARLAVYTGINEYAEWADKTWDQMSDVDLIIAEYYVRIQGFRYD